MKYLRGFLAVIITWYLMALVMQAPIIPYPHAVLLHLVFSMQTAKPYLHLLLSLYRIAMGMALALFFAIPTGMLAGRTQKLDQLISPVLYLLYPLPKIAFLPVFMVLFGIGDLSKIMLIAVIIFFPASVTIRDGVKEISVQYLELAQAYHLTQTQILRDILWPFILPRIFSSLRITLGISLSVLFISENYAATYGLGYYIMNNWVMAQYVGMYAGIVLLSLLGLTLYVALDGLERLVIPSETR
ncbi:MULTISPECIES: ABC transporter permease [unclassified Sphaerochaeta]|jgi:NitT/TauT family transport system permease protein|uniref:ABC transporter permease n=1 Tax=unclassified Sphaerochaeta TaxID=2637943 RepID=UPI0025F0DAE5|nr:ABC transporter permease [Sphaerochaeta sp. UBA5856]